MWLFVLSISFLSAFLGTRLSIALAHKWQVLDYPGEIKIHAQPVSRLGGIGIWLGFVGGSLFVLVVQGEGIGWWAIFISSLAVVATGFADDVHGLRPLQKVVGQLLGAAIFLFFAYKIYRVAGVGIFPSLLLGLGIVVFLVGLSNSINLLDGMDGIAAGSSALMACFLAFVLNCYGASSIALLALALVGGCLGFLVYNCPPARTFMGDIGSLFIGFIVAVLAVHLLFVAGLGIRQVLGVALIFSVPLVDTSFAIIRRLLSHQEVFGGDRCHLYDCLHSHLNYRIKLTLVFIWCLVFFGGILGTFVFIFHSIAPVIAGVVFLGALCVLAAWSGCLGPGIKVSAGTSSRSNIQR